MKLSLVTLLIGFMAAPVLAATPPACRGGSQRIGDPDAGWSACVPEDWTRRSRGSEVVWSPGPGLDLVFSFQVKVMEGREVSAPLVAYLKKQGAELHVSPSGQLKYRLKGADGVGLVEHRGRFGLLIYTGCAAPGEACEGLVQQALAARDSVVFAPEPTVPYAQWAVRERGGLLLSAAPGSPAAGDLDWLAQVYGEGYETLLGLLDVKPAGAPVRCYFYKDLAEVYRYTRRNSGFAITESPGEVHSRFGSRADRQTTGHELTHVITARAWGQANEALLGEGIAVAMDLSGREHHARARAAVTDLDPGFRLSSMLGKAWWSHDPELSYGVSGSVVTFLLAEGGIAKVRALYKAVDLAAALKLHYGWTLDDLDTRWRKAAGF